MIKRVEDRWVLYSQDGKRILGTFDTHKQAIRRERMLLLYKKK